MKKGRPHNNGMAHLDPGFGSKMNDCLREGI